MLLKLKKACLAFIYVGFGLIALSPLLLDNRFYFPFITTKVLVFRIAVEIIFLAYLVLNVVSEEYRPRISWITILTTSFIAVAALSSVFGPDLNLSFWGDIERGEGLLLWFHLLAFLLVLTGTLRTKKSWLWLLDFSVGVAILMSLFGLGQALQLKGLLATSGNRVDATLGNAAFFAAYLLLNLGFVVYLYLERSTRAARIYYLLVGLFFLFLIPATQTRGAAIGLAAGVIVAALLLAIDNWHNPKIKRVSISLVLLVVLLGAGGFAVRGKPWIAKVPALQRITSISLSERTAQTRLATWQAALKGMKERPILGWGLENFQIVFNKHFPSIIYEDEGSQVWFDRAHNVIFDRGTTTGVLGLAVFLALLLYAPIYLIRHRGQNPRAKTAAAVFGAFFMAYLVQDLFIFESVATYIVLFLLLGFLSSEYLPEITWPAKVLRFRSAWVGLAVIYGLLLWPILWNVNVYPAKLNIAATKALQSNSKEEDFFVVVDRHKQYLNAPKYSYGLPEYQLQFIDFIGLQLAPVGEIVERVKPVLAFTDEQIEKLLAEQPDDAKNWLLAMRHYNYTYASIPDKKYERLEKALSFFPQAEELSPARPHIYQEAGYASQYRYRQAKLDGKKELMEESYRQAEQYFQKTVDLSPSVYASYVNLISFYLESGDTAKIKPLIEQMEQNRVNFRTWERLSALFNTAKARQNFFWSSFFAEEMSKLQPDNPQTFINWALSEAYLGNREKAIEIAEKIKAFGEGFVGEAETFISNVRSGFYEKQVSQ